MINFQKLYKFINKKYNYINLILFIIIILTLLLFLNIKIITSYKLIKNLKPIYIENNEIDYIVNNKLYGNYISYNYIEKDKRILCNRSYICKIKDRNIIYFNYFLNKNKFNKLNYKREKFMKYKLLKNILLEDYKEYAKINISNYILIIEREEFEKFIKDYYCINN